MVAGRVPGLQGRPQKSAPYGVALCGDGCASGKHFHRRSEPSREPGQQIAPMKYNCRERAEVRWADNYVNRVQVYLLSADRGVHVCRSGMRDVVDDRSQRASLAEPVFKLAGNEC